MTVYGRKEFPRESATQRIGISADQDLEAVFAQMVRSGSQSAAGWFELIF